MSNRDAYLALFTSLLGAESIDDLVGPSADRALVARQLLPMRGRPHLQVVSIAVNGERVDVVARDGDLEWRIVFGTPDVQRVDWLSIFQRPCSFMEVDGGRAIVVNGPSSSGKSGVLKAVQSRSDLPWVVFDEPTFGSVNVEWLIWRDRAEVLHRGFLDGIAALALAGNCVAVAAGGHPQAWFDEAFADVPTLRVGLDCEAVELARRERTREDVPGGLAESSLDVHEGWNYHLRFDTAITEANAVADQVLLAMNLQPFVT